MAAGTRALLIVDPSAGMHARADDIGPIRNVLEDAGMRLDVVECAESGPTAEECARRAVNEGALAVYVPEARTP